MSATVPEPDALPTLPSAVHRALVLALDPAAVRDARRLIRDVCRTARLDADTCDSAVLLTSEMVTNAFTHGGSEARLQADADQEVIVVQVADDNSRHPLHVPPDPQALDGRGMEIVQMVASRWGVRDDPYGKTVWFEVRTAG